MNTIKQRTDRVKNLIAKIKTHCMTFNFEETATHYVVYYPYGYFPNGAQASKDNGKINALELLLSAIENHWQQSFITGE